MPRMWGLDPDQYRNMPVITDIARKVIATQMVTRSQPGVALRCGASPDSVGSVMWSIVLELPHTALSDRIDELLPNLSVAPRREHRCQATPRSQ